MTDKRRPEIHAKGDRPKTLHVWPDQSLPDPATRETLCGWMRENGIDPKDVALQPITLEFVPGCAGSLNHCNGVSSAPWWISFTQRYRDAEGNWEINALTGGPAQFVRTVPLTAEPPLDLVPEWAREATYIQDEPHPRMLRLSEVREMNDEGDG